MSQIEARVGAAAPSATMVSSHRMLRLRDWITGIGICALAIGLTAYQLGARPLWNDEAWTAWIGLSVVDFHGLLNQIQVRAFNMSLYYAIIFAWVHFWGAHGVLSTEWIVRLPSLVFAALSAVAVWLIGRRFLGGFAGALGAVLYVCNIAQLDAAQQARSYPLLLLLVCLSWYALLVLVSSPSSHLWWVVYVVTNVLANYAHILNALDIMAQAAAFGLFLSLDTVWRARARALWKGMLLSLVVIGVLAIPLLWLMVHQNNQSDYLGSPHVSDLLHLFVGYVAGSSSVARALVVLCVLVGLVAVLSDRFPQMMPALGRWRNPRGGQEAARAAPPAAAPLAVALACWLLGSVFLAFVIARSSSAHLFSARYEVFVVPALCLLVALGGVVASSALGARRSYTRCAGRRTRTTTAVLCASATSRLAYDHTLAHPELLLRGWHGVPIQQPIPSMQGLHLYVLSVLLSRRRDRCRRDHGAG